VEYSDKSAGLAHLVNNDKPKG